MNIIWNSYYLAIKIIDFQRKGIIDAIYVFVFHLITLFFNVRIIERVISVIELLFCYFYITQYYTMTY